MREKIMKENRQMPEIPTGFRELPSSEKIQPGDLAWMGTKWLEVAASNLTVLEPRVGFYCRKFSSFI